MLQIIILSTSGRYHFDMTCKVDPFWITLVYIIPIYYYYYHYSRRDTSFASPAVVVVSTITT